MNPIENIRINPRSRSYASKTFLGIRSCSTRKRNSGSGRKMPKGAGFLPVADGGQGLLERAGPAADLSSRSFPRGILQGTEDRARRA